MSSADALVRWAGESLRLGNEGATASKGEALFLLPDLCSHKGLRAGLLLEKTLPHFLSQLSPLGHQALYKTWHVKEPLCYTRNWVGNLSRRFRGEGRCLAFGGTEETLPGRAAVCAMVTIKHTSCQTCKCRNHKEIIQSAMQGMCKKCTFVQTHTRDTVQINAVLHRVLRSGFLGAGTRVSPWLFSRALCIVFLWGVQARQQG